MAETVATNLITVIAIVVGGIALVGAICKWLADR